MRASRGLPRAIGEGRGVERGGFQGRAVEPEADGVLAGHGEGLQN